MTDCGQETFVVKFRGELVECSSLDDAQALKSARDFLEDYLGCEPSAEDCEVFFGESLDFKRLCAVETPAFQTDEQPSDRPLSRVGA